MEKIKLGAWKIKFTLVEKKVCKLKRHENRQYLQDDKMQEIHANFILLNFCAKFINIYESSFYC